MKMTEKGKKEAIKKGDELYRERQRERETVRDKQATDG